MRQRNWSVEAVLHPCKQCLSLLPGWKGPLLTEQLDEEISGRTSFAVPVQGDGKVEAYFRLIGRLLGRGAQKFQTALVIAALQCQPTERIRDCAVVRFQAQAAAPS